MHFHNFHFLYEEIRNIMIMGIGKSLVIREFDWWQQYKDFDSTTLQWQMDWNAFLNLQNNNNCILWFKMNNVKLLSTLVTQMWE